MADHGHGPIKGFGRAFERAQGLVVGRGHVRDRVQRAACIINEGLYRRFDVLGLNAVEGYVELDVEERVFHARRA